MTEEKLYDKLDELKTNIENSNMSEKDKLLLLKNIQNLRDQKINILITGATGCGKALLSMHFSDRMWQRSARLPTLKQ